MTATDEEGLYCKHEESHRSFLHTLSVYMTETTAALRVVADLIKRVTCNPQQGTITKWIRKMEKGS